MMFPFAPAPGTFTGMRPTAQQLDAPLSDDDRTGLRVLYHDPNDTQFIGSIQGRILPANPLSLPASPPGITGIFGTHVVAIDASSGAVIAGTLGGWSCQSQGPAKFEGTYQIGALVVNHTYKIYAEPLNGAVGPAEVSNSLVSLCRNSTTDPVGPASILRRPQPQPGIHYRHPLFPVATFKWGIVTLDCALEFSCSWVFLRCHPDRNGRFLFCAAVWRVGHGVEGPLQHLNSI
jgi:hypothetical protein